MEYSAKELTTGEEFGLPLLKYATRILKKFPLSDIQQSLHRLPLLPGFEKQLIYVKDIQPSLSRGEADENHKRQRTVSRDKLSYLWQHCRSKAIDIILNISMFPSPRQLSMIRLAYFMAKCQSPPTKTLTPPPWSTSIETVIPDYYPSTAQIHF